MKEITGFSNYYITTCGEVISKRTGNKMSKTLDTVGYYWVGIRRNDGVLKKIRIHRLMGIMYLNLDYDDKTQKINHKNSDKKKNYLSNLEIVNNSYNTNEGYLNSNYTTRNKIKIKAININTGEELMFNSLRECESKLKISRKLIPLILNNDKPNNTDYKFEYIDFKIPYWIRDEKGMEFQSCRNCSKFYKFDEGGFRDSYNLSNGLKFTHKNINFEKFIKVADSHD